MKKLNFYLFIFCFSVISAQTESLSVSEGSFNYEMVFVEGGAINMGSETGEPDEKPVHSVIVGSFYIGKYEVTQKDWIAIMGENPSEIKGDNLPVESVSFKKVCEFIGKLNQKTGKKYRLPTEAEWEYAARGGRKSKGYKYSGSNNYNDVAWHWENAKKTSHPVGTKAPNELGIYDMSGNVWEWCLDWYDEKYYQYSSVENPKGPQEGECRVVRGGSWTNLESSCTNAFRYDYFPSLSFNDTGFRLILEE